MSMFNLQPIYLLFQKKEKELQVLIGNLQLDQVKSPELFELNVNRIKKSIILTPLSISEPLIISHRQEDRNISPHYNNPMRSGNSILVSLQYLCSGSIELFNYSPSTYTFSTSSTRIFQPDYGSQISIEVEVPQLDKEIVLARAHRMMETTLSHINQVNPEAKNWSEGIIPTVDRLTQEKQKEILDFYK